MNLLITSIGQRGYLIDHFKESLGENVGVYAADATKYAPALHNADKAFVIPMAKNQNYYQKLLSVCKENNISIVLSINDLELPILAQYKNDLEKNNIKAIISNKEVIEICFDKYKTYKFCINNNIPVPRTYLYTEEERIIRDLEIGIISLPLIAKPRKGSRSVGIHIVHTIKQLNEDVAQMKLLNINEDEKLMFQEYIDSEQFSIHVFNDNSLKPVSVVTMVNLFNHFGETFHIKTLRDKNLTELGVKIGNKLKHLGPLSADVHKRENGEYVVLEFNPRISGCYSLSHYAGADYPRKILDLALGNPINFSKVDSFEDGVIMLKQFSTMKLSEPIVNNKVAYLD